MKNLKVLDLSENSLMDLPKQILELTHLQVSLGSKDILGFDNGWKSAYQEV